MKEPKEGDKRNPSPCSNCGQIIYEVYGEYSCYHNSTTWEWQWQWHSKPEDCFQYLRKRIEALEKK